MTKLELQNKIATIEKSMAKITNPAVLAIAEKNLTQAREQLAALEGATPSPAPSGGGSELEKLYEQREKLKKGLQSSNAVVQKASKMALPKVEAQIAELEGAKPAPAPARRMPKPKAETPEVPATKPMPTPAKRGRKPIPPAPMPTPTPAKRGRKPKAEAPMPMPTPAKRGRKPKAEAPAEEKPKIKRGRKPKAQAPAEAPAVTPARRGRPALPKGAKSQEVSLNSLTKLANAIVQFCDENGIANPTIDDVRGILNILDKNKALKFAKGGKISRSGKYLSKWQIKQILTDGGMKIGSDEILSGVWLKKKVDGVAEMRMGGGVGYFAVKDDIIESRKSVRFGNRRVSSRNPKVVGVLEGKMVGNLMKVYDYDDEMWKVVNPDEWQQAYAEGGGLGRKLDFESKEYDMPRGKTIYIVEVEDEYEDDKTIEEEYDNYDEAISAYRRSKLRFPITWVTYLETQKPPYVYERGIVLPNGTLKVMSRKGKDVNYDFNGNEIYAKGGAVGEKRYFLTGYSAYASYDSYDEGEGENVSNWDDKISKTFSSKDDLINYISKNITYTDHTESDFDWEVGDGKYIVTSVLCSYGDDGGYYPASKSEIDQWKKGKKELYNVDYFIYVVAAIPTKYAEGGGVGEFVVEIYSTNFENTLISKKNFKTEKAAIRYAYSVDDLNDDGFYFNIYGLDKNGKTLIRAFGLEEADEDLIKQNPKYKNCISWKLDMRVASYPNNKTIFSKTFSTLDKALELGISLENESLSATINNLDYTTFVYANNYAKGGGVEIPKNKSLRHFILNEMSDGMIANKVPYSDYDTIGKIRIQAFQILNRDGDREYSMQSVSDLIQEALLEYEENKNYAEGGGVGIPNAAWFVFQEKFPEAFEYYLKNNEYGVSKGDLMAMAYESTRNVDSAIPMELWKQVDDTMFYVYDYQNSSFGELVDLREKIKTSEVPVALSFVIDMHGYYGDDLPNELKNADFATALMYVYANRDVIDEFQIRPKRNVDNYAEGGEVDVKYDSEENLFEDAFLYLKNNLGIEFSKEDFEKTDSYENADYYVLRQTPSNKYKVERLLSLIGRSKDMFNSLSIRVNKNYLWGNSKFSLSIGTAYVEHPNLLKSEQNFFIFPKYVSKYGDIKGGIKYAKGGGVDMYSKFDFNEKGNLSARINQKNYEIEYNDADGVYELFENGERVQSNKNVRTLMQFIQVSDVGNFREGQSVTIAEDNDNENYDDFRGKELVIYHKATNEKEHRGFDNSMEGQALYSFFLRETGEQVPFSCYDYELEQY